MELKWDDGIGSRGRDPWLLLIKGEKIVAFAGQNIPGVAVIRGTDYSKNGKWSATTFRIETAEGVRAIPGMNGWETGRFVEGLRSAVSGSGPIDRWPDVAQALGVSVPSAMAFLRQWRPKAAEALDQVDAELAALDEAAEEAQSDADIETIVVSFGSPNRRMMAEGFWQLPKTIPGYDGEIRLVDPTKGWTKENITVTGVAGSVLSATHADGYHGGYVSVSVAVVPGTVVERPAEVVSVDPVDVADRERLALVLNDQRDGTNGDLGLARRVDAFVQNAITRVGAKRAANVLRDEANQAYGRGARTAGINQAFGDIDHQGLDWASGRDILSVALWAEHLAGSGHSEVEVITAVAAHSVAFKDEGKRWFRCQGCGTGTVRISNTDYEAFSRGQSVVCTCPTCGASGSTTR